MKKLLLGLVLLTSMASASALTCSGNGYDVSVNGSSMDVSGAANFTSNVTRTVEFNEVYRGTVGQAGVNAVELIVSWDGSATLVLRKSHETQNIPVSCK